jgi:hypothetical protein
MRERVTLLGGTLTTGPSDGAFVVRAVLPAGAATPVPAPGPAPGGDERTPD